MRRYVVSVLTSLDGFYEGPDHDLSVLPFEDAFNDHNLALLRDTHTLVYGGRWFPDNWAHWTAVRQDPTSAPRDREIAELVLSLPGLVISDSLAAPDDAPWAATTRVVRREDATREVARLKEGEGGHLLSFASSTTWNPLFAAGLVDELVVLVGAGLTGGGSPLWSGPPVPLTLLGSRVLPGSSLVELRYAPADRP